MMWNSEGIKYDRSEYDRLWSLVKSRGHKEAQGGSLVCFVIKSFFCKNVRVELNNTFDCFNDCITVDFCVGKQLSWFSRA